MHGKFFTTTVKPTTFVVGDMDGGAYNANDVLFDWHGFKIPTGTARLMGATAVIRGNDGTAQSLAGELYFATSGDFTFGTSDAALSAQQLGNFVFGFVDFEDKDDSPALSNVKISEMTRDTNNTQVLFAPRTEQIGSSAPNIGADGFTTYYMAFRSTGTPNFASTVTINMTDAADLAALGTAVLTVDTKDPRITMSPGDVLVAQDGAAVGTIKSIDSDVQITLTSPHTAALTNNDELYIQSPVSFILNFEY